MKTKILFLCFILLLSSILPCFTTSAQIINENEYSFPVGTNKPYTVSLTHAKTVSGHTDDGTELTDRIFAQKTANNNKLADQWIGYQSDGEDFTVEITLDLEYIYSDLHHLNAMFTQRTSLGAYFPEKVTYSFSIDGKSFSNVTNASLDVDPDSDPSSGIFTVCSTSLPQARYIKMTIYGNRGETVYISEFVVEALSNSVIHFSENAVEGTTYTDYQGVTYRIQNGTASVTDFQDGSHTTVYSQDTTLYENWDIPGDYDLPGSDGEITVHSEFVKESDSTYSHCANDIQYIVIHNTGEPSQNAVGKTYLNRLLSLSGDTSWHYTVDNSGIIYHTVPDRYTAWHAGNVQNYTSIGIEMCVNGAPTKSNGDFIMSGSSYDKWYNNVFSDTLDATALLVTELLLRYGLDEDAVIEHNDCSGKNCPQWLRYSSTTKGYIHDGDLWLELKARIHQYYTSRKNEITETPTATSVSIPEYLVFQGGITYPVTSVNDEAFMYKSEELVEIQLPKTITEISDTAFAGSSGLQSVTISDKNNSFYSKNGILYSQTGEIVFQPVKQVPIVQLPHLLTSSPLSYEEVESGSVYLLGVPVSSTAETLRKYVECESIKVYSSTGKIGTGTLINVDGAYLRAVVKADANGDGSITAIDYILAKRYVLGTYQLGKTAIRALAITNGKTVGSYDYIKIKRYVLGTYRF